MGDHIGYARYSNTTAPQTILSKVILANQMGTKGTLTVHAVVRLDNGASGGQRNMTVIVTFGGTTLFAYTPVDPTYQNLSNLIEVWVTIANRNSASAQVASIMTFDLRNLPASIFPYTFVDNHSGWNRASIDTTGDQMLNISGMMDFKSSALAFEVLTVELFGPTSQ